MSTLLKVAVGALGLYIVVTKGHNVFRYVWLNYDQSPRDWTPLLQHLPAVRSVNWDLPFTPGKMDILMLQSYTKNIAPYADLSAQINKHYCDAHGYKYKAIVSDAPVDPERNPCWDKVWHMLQECKKANAVSDTDAPWLFWIDSDAAIDHQDLPLEAIRWSGESPSLTHLYICTSIYFTKCINAGVMMIRLGPTMQKFLEDLWAWPHLRWRQGRYHEQNAIEEMIAKDVNGICTSGALNLFGCTEFNSTYQHGLRVKGKFLQHYRGCSTEKRVAAFKDILATF